MKTYKLLSLLLLIGTTFTANETHAAQGGNGGTSGGLKILPPDNELLNYYTPYSSGKISYEAISFRLLQLLLEEGLKNYTPDSKYSGSIRREAATIALQRYFFFNNDFSRTERAEITRLWLELYRKYISTKGVPNERDCADAFEKPDANKANLACGFAFFGLEVVSDTPLLQYLQITTPRTKDISSSEYTDKKYRLANNLSLDGALVNGKPWQTISFQQTMEIFSAVRSYRRIRGNDDRERVLLLQLVFHRAIGDSKSSAPTKILPFSEQERFELFDAWKYFLYNNPYAFGYVPGNSCESAFTKSTPDYANVEAACGFQLVGISKN